MLFLPTFHFAVGYVNRHWAWLPVLAGLYEEITVGGSRFVPLRPSRYSAPCEDGSVVFKSGKWWIDEFANSARHHVIILELMWEGK